MALTIAAERYNEIRRKVRESSARRLADEGWPLMENARLPRTFHSVDEFVSYLDSLADAPD